MPPGTRVTSAAGVPSRPWPPRPRVWRSARSPKAPWRLSARSTPWPPRRALQTALAAARRIAGAALDRYPLDVIEETVAQCLAQAAQEPRIVVRVGERVAEALKARLITLSEDVGYAGRIVVSVEPRLAAADCRLEWSDGGVERDAAAIAERIEAALQRFIDADLRRATETIGA